MSRTGENAFQPGGPPPAGAAGVAGVAGGFTLLEVLLALVILGMMMSIIYGTFYSSFETKRRIEEAQEYYHRLRIFNKRLGEELAGVFLSDAYKTEAANPDFEIYKTSDMRYYFLGEEGGPFDRLAFTTNAGRTRSNKPQADLIQVSYETRGDEGSELRTLYRVEKPITIGEARPDDEGKRYMIFKNVKQFNLTYVNRKTENELLDGWDSGDKSYDEEWMSYPRAVEVELTTVDDDDIEHFAKLLLPTPNAFEGAEGCR